MDLIVQKEYIEGKNVTVKIAYRKNFTGEKICGYVNVYGGRNDDDENYELYREVIECGLDEDGAMKVFYNMIRDIREGIIEL